MKEEVFPKVIQEVINRLCRRINEQIKKAYRDGYDWIGFEYDFTRDFEIRLRATMTKGTMPNANKYDTIYDLKQLRERYNGASIEFIEKEK